MKYKIFFIFLLFVHTQLQSKLGTTMQWVYNTQGACSYTQEEIKKYQCMNKENPQHTCSVKLLITKKNSFFKSNTLKMINMTKHTDNCHPSESRPSFLTQSWTTVSSCVKVSGNLYNCDLVQTDGSEMSFPHLGGCSIFDDNQTCPTVNLCYHWPKILAKHTLEFDDKTGYFTLKYRGDNISGPIPWHVVTATAIRQ